MNNLVSFGVFGELKELAKPFCEGITTKSNSDNRVRVDSLSYFILLKVDVINNMNIHHLVQKEKYDSVIPRIQLVIIIMMFRKYGNNTYNTASRLEAHMIKYF